MKLRAKLIFGGLGVFLLLGLALFLFRKSGESALEKYKAELRAKGEKLTFSELLPSHDASDQELSIFIGAAKMLNHPQFYPGGIDWGRTDTPGTVRPIAARTNIPVGEYSNGVSSEKNASWASVAQPVSAHADSLKSIREFLETPPTRLNVTYDSSLTLPKNCFIEKRVAAQWLGASALLNLHSNQVEAATEDVRAIFALAEMHCEEPTLVNQIIRVAITGLASEAAWELLAHNQTQTLEDAQLMHLQESIARTDLLEGLERGMMGERNFTLLAFEFMRKDSRNLSKAASRFTQFDPNVPATVHGLLQSTGDYLAGSIWRHSVAPYDELFYLRFMHKDVETIRSLRNEQNFSRTYVMLTNHQSELQEMSNSWKRLKYPFSTLCIPHLIKAHQACVANEARRRLTLTAVALKRYQVRNGHFPSALNALIPEFMAEVPIDCLDGKPLRYKLAPAGTFVLYSVGKDGEDNGGDPTPVEQPGWSDMTTGRDIVWPTPVY